MTVLTGTRLADVGITAAAIKPTETDLDRLSELDVSTITIDYEGRDYLPETRLLAELADSFDIRLTMPVRADGFDPLGDDSGFEAVPDTVSSVLVAGHSAYLTESEARRAVAPRLEAATTRVEDPWVGTEGIERIALAVGGTQYELLSRTTRRDVRALRNAGFDGEIALYAPTVLTEEEDTILDAVGEYAARRKPVRRALPEDAATDSAATERARAILSEACRDYALVGDTETVAKRVEGLYDTGVDHIVAYPARGLDAVLE